MRGVVFTIVLWLGSPPLLLARDDVFPARFYPFAPADLAAGDIDNDGDVDFVGSGPNGLQTLRAEGNGQFTLLAPSPSPYYLSVALAQLDADGKLDAVTGGLSGVFALKGDGAGGFGPPFQLLTGLQNGFPRVGDLNEDGHPDVVNGNATVGFGFTVIYGTGAGPTNPPLIQPGGGGGGQVELVDLDNDSHLDVLAVGPGINSWLGDGAGAFVLASVPPAAGTAPSIVHADFDQDSISDLITIPLFASTGSFWKGASDGTFGNSGITIALEFGTYKALDFDQDGRTDLAFAEQDVPGSLRILRGTGPAQFSTTVIDLPVETTVSRVFPHDVDDDGDLDLWIQGNGLTRLRCAGPGHYETVDTYALVDPIAVTFFDVDDDGWDDAVAGRAAAQLAVALGSQSGSFGAFVIGPPAAFGSTVDLGPVDLDLDGDLDVVSAGTVQTHVLENDGTGSFTLIQSVSNAPGMTPLRQAVGDGDGDGVPDLFVIDWGPGPFGTTFGGLRWARGSATGTLLAWSTLFSGNTAPSDLTIGDFDADGATDAMLAANNVVSYFESQAGSFLPAQVISLAGANLRKAEAGDLDHDGDLDLLLLDRAAFGGLRSAIHSQGTFTISPAIATIVSPNADVSLDSGDADGDGRLDAILLGEVGASAVFEIARGDGAGSFAPSSSFSTPAPILPGTQVRVFDGDHDGRIDLGFPSPDRDRVVISRNVLEPFFEYAGTGCPGISGFVPRLRIDGVATPGGIARLSLENGLGGSSALFFTGLQFASLPLPGGCPLLASPLLPIVFQLPLDGSGPGNGSFELAGPLPGALTVGSSFVFQALVLDPGAPYGFSATNATELTVQ